MAHKWDWYYPAIASPWLLWGLLAIFARWRPGILRRLYPWLTALCWTIWIASIVLVAGTLITYPSPDLFQKECTLVIPVSVVLILIMLWARRRVHPERYPKRVPGFE
jgi:hypothetical protein